MRLYKLKRERTVGDFGLYNAQLYVGEFSDTKGNMIKGMAVLNPNRAFETPFAVTKEDALSFSQLLAQVTPKIPSMKMGISLGWLSRFGMSFDGYLEKWLDTDGYSGSISIYLNWIPIKVTSRTVKELSDCLARFYES